MKDTTARKAVRIAGLLILGAVALMAQSPVNNQENPRSQTLAAVQSATPLQAADVLKIAPVPNAFSLAMPQDHSANANGNGSSKSWFTSGPDAFVAAVHMNPAFDLPYNRYGAAPAAVRFSFGKK